ncbi:MAG: hypothetical protein HQL67_03810 [Magnetococcales bacterium]|nr:hypothetical protein [Magnetococcales bacterium]
MKTKIATTLSTNQSVVLHGPGVIKVKATNTVALSKSAISHLGASHATGSATGAAKIGATMTAVTPLIGLAILTVGTVYLVKEWLKRSI